MELEQGESANLEQVRKDLETSFLKGDDLLGDKQRINDLNLDEKGNPVRIDVADIITKAANQYRIDPDIIIAMIQLESGTIVGRNGKPAIRPTGDRGDIALSLLIGYGKPSTMAAQISDATKQLRLDLDRLDAGKSTGPYNEGWRVGVTRQTDDGVNVTPSTRTATVMFAYNPIVGPKWGATSPKYARYGGRSALCELFKKLFGKDYNQPPVAKLIATPLEGDAPLKVRLDASMSCDLDVVPGPLMFHFYYGDGFLSSGNIKNSSSEYTYSTRGVYTAKVVVTDADGVFSENSVMINVCPVEVTDISPIGKIKEKQPQITATVQSDCGVFATVMLELDGFHVAAHTPNKAIDTITYTPSSLLSQGSHTAALHATTKNNQIVEKIWSFEVEAPSAFVFIIQEKVSLNNEKSEVWEQCNRICGKSQSFGLEQTLEGRIDVIGKKGVPVEKHLKEIRVEGEKINVTFNGQSTSGLSWVRQGEEPDPTRFTIRQRRTVQYDPIIFDPLKEYSIDDMDRSFIGTITVTAVTREGKTQSISLVGWADYATTARKFQTYYDYDYMGENRFCHYYGLKVENIARTGTLGSQWKAVKPDDPSRKGMVEGSLELSDADMRDGAGPPPWKCNISVWIEGTVVDTSGEELSIYHYVNSIQDDGLYPPLPTVLQRPNITGRVQRVYSQSELDQIQSLGITPIEYDVVLE
jgi:PKD repeat protein